MSLSFFGGGGLFEFILLFFPGLLSTSISVSVPESFTSQNHSSENVIKQLLMLMEIAIVNIVVNNIISLLFFTRVYRITPTILDGHLNPAIQSISYMIIAFFVSILWGYTFRSLKLNFRFRLSIEPRAARDAKETKSKG